jgi:hypothetical protein
MGVAWSRWCAAGAGVFFAPSRGAWVAPIDTIDAAASVTATLLAMNAFKDSIVSQAGKGGIGRLGVPNTISVIALMLRFPYRNGMMRRRGAPCLGGIGASFTSQASITCGFLSVATASSPYWRSDATKRQ